MAIRLKAENADWSYPRIAAEAERLLALESSRLDRRLAERDDAGLRSAAFAGPIAP